MFEKGDLLTCIKGFPKRLTEGKTYVVQQMGTEYDRKVHGNEEVVRIVQCDQGYHDVRFITHHFELQRREHFEEDLFNV